jgi:lauroyl/myristoyl acyltransferase
MNLAVQTQKFAIILVRVVPLKVADRIARTLGLLFCKLSKTRRRQVLNNLHHIFPDGRISREQTNFYLKNTFVNYARAMIDFLRLSFMSKEDFTVEMIGFDNIAKALRHGRGCIVLSLHIGNWDYGGAYLAARGAPMSALVEETKPEMYDLYTKHRERLGMKTFPLSRAGYAFLHAIKSNRALAVLGDRDIMKNGIPVDFFSGRRNIPRGLSQIVIKRRLPVVFSYIVLHPTSRKERYLCCLEDPVFFSGCEQEFNRTMVEKFETYILKYPDQWMLFQSDWIV